MCTITLRRVRNAWHLTSHEKPVLPEQLPLLSPGVESTMSIAWLQALATL